MSGRSVQFVDHLSIPVARGQPRRFDPVLLGRIRFLSDDDQQLLHLAFSGRTYRDLAALHSSNPGSVCRRVSRLTRRLSEPIVAALLEMPTGLSAEYRDVGIDRHLHGLGLRTLSHKHKVSQREVKAILKFLSSWFKSTGGSHGHSNVPAGDASCPLV